MQQQPQCNALTFGRFFNQKQLTYSHLGWPDPIPSDPKHWCCESGCVCDGVFRVNERATVWVSTLFITHSACRGTGSVTAKLTHSYTTLLHLYTHATLKMNALVCVNTEQAVTRAHVHRHTFYSYLDPQGSSLK